MDRARGVDVLIVSLGSTEGLRRADRELSDALMRSGLSVATERADPPARVRTMLLTDLAWARSARAAAQRGLGVSPSASRVRAVIYSSTTAALLWPRAGAIRFDATAAGNRPGRHGLWQRPVEGRRLAEAPLLLPWSDAALAEAPATARRGDRALALPVPVEPSLPPRSAVVRRERDIAALTYAANPAKKGFERVLAAWRKVAAERRSSGRGSSGRDELLVAGASPAALERFGLPARGEPGIRVLGTLPPQEYRALLRRARAFVCAPRREDYGIAQLEALADGCQLVTTPSPGPYAALEIARTLDSRLVAEELEGPLRTALEDPLPDYQDRARAALAPFSREAVDRVIVDRLLPRLLA